MSLDPLDVGLSLCLMLVVPAYNLWRSLTRDRRPPETRERRYLRGMAIAAVLTALLVIVWSDGERPLAQLGLGWPIAVPGLIGLGIAAALLLGLAAMSWLTRPCAEAPPPSPMLPETPAEWRLFVISMPIIAVAWELLYRGYLVWMIEPRLGIVAAVVLPALAYGVAHGYQGRTQFIGSIVSALLFTLGFVLTRSLWWLMLIHVALPLFGAVAQKRVSAPR